MMTTDIAELRRHIVEEILARQDDAFRWGHDENQALLRPEYLYYSPNFRSTLWTLVLLADLQAPAGLPQIQASIRLISDHFHAPEHGVFRLPGMSHFPIPCLNGNLLYLHHYFGTAQAELLDQTIVFFATHQRFDDDAFITPPTYPYGSNTSCYGRHTCIWGVTKLLKGISFIPKTKRTSAAQRLIENCIEFVLHHQVCFRSHAEDKFLARDIDRLTFPSFYKSDFLEILWLLAREGVHDRRMSRALELLRSRMKEDGTWELEKSSNIIVPIGRQGCVNPFITARAAGVLKFYGT